MKVFCDNWCGEEERTVMYVEGRMQGWEKYWQSFIDNDYQARLLFDKKRDENKDYFKSKAFGKIEAYYYELKGKMGESLKALQPPEPVVQNRARKTNECKLPILEPPKFDGDFLNWPSFADLFKSTIGQNADLSASQKLQYLRSSLTGDASNILRTTQITDANYEPAWKLLEERFSNRSALVAAQVNALFGLKKAANTNDIKHIYDITNQCLQSLDNLDVKTENWDPILIHMSFEKLPLATQLLWNQLRFGKRDVPKWPEMKEFLHSCFTSAEIQQPKPTTSNTIQQRPTFKRTQAMHATSPNPNVCKMQECQEKHSIRICPLFLKLTVPERIEKARQLGLCLNCLSHGHRTVKCNSERKCLTCNKRHHTLLHLPTEANKTTSSNHTTALNALAPAWQIKSVPILLATTIINVSSKCGIVHQLRALVDNGSQSSFITERAVQLLQLKKTPSRTQVYGLGKCDAGTSVSSTSFIIGSLRDPLFALQMNALVMPTISNLLPTENINIRDWNHLTGIELADPEFFEPKNIDILLGANVYSSIILDGTKIGDRGTPIAQKTVFGWILTGPTNASRSQSNQVVTLHQQTELTNEHLRRFFDCDEIPADRKLTDEDIECEEQFKRTTYRDQSGRYVVSLPFKTNISLPLLGDSYQSAQSRFNGLEKRMIRNSQFANDYSQCMNEYVKLDHMEKAESTNVKNYLAHQAVIKLSSSTTKLRVVFDASNKTTNGRSLNDILMVGPRLQEDLTFILLRWRKHRYALSADVAKMYRQVLVNPEHRDYQCVLWRDTTNERIETYRMKRVTFGIASAQYLAVRAMQQLADDEKEKYPAAAAIAKQDFYVDDLFTGASTFEKACELQMQLTNLLSSGGFPLRQWSSNSSQLLKNVPIDDRENKSLEYEENAIVKTLGVNWTPRDDRFVFKVSLSADKQQPTKRTILSDVARMYDPQGWLAPIIFIAKLVLKRCWTLKKDWDDELPVEISTFWTEFRSKLNAIEQISIHRWINYEENNDICELHGFCDASEKGYAAVVYARITNSNGNVHINMLAAKTRVSSMKPMTVARLELCGAKLMAVLMRKIRNAMKIDWSAIHAWCDSQIALSWIHSEPQRLKTYVANCVVEVNNNLNDVTWHYIRSAHNPADCATRGVDPDKLKESNLWWSGPSWLMQPSSQWPNEKWSHKRDEKEEKCEAAVFLNTNDRDLSYLFHKYSSLMKLFRIVAYCRRFIFYLKVPKSMWKKEPFQSDEIEIARNLCVQWVQQKSFAKEINEKKNNPSQPVHAQSRLRNLNPYWDEKCGLLRIDGRLHNADIPFNQKCPVILPKDNQFTRLYIQHVHELTLHGGPTTVVAYIQRRYWILDARNTVRYQLWKCVTCFRFKADRVQQLMAPLPSGRVNFTRAFAHVGIDFAGPIDLKTAIGRGKSSYKGYFAIFICLASKAIHIEAVTGLSTDKFIAAFDRFIARRGLCTDAYSDCGTSFVGANKQLGTELQQCLRQTTKMAAEILSRREINWHFNPPASAHFGGIWESGVKSIKYHLKRGFANKVFTYEELSTALCQIEACLNSRPLCPMYADPNDLNFLTPAHLLGIDAPLSRPEPSLLDLNENRLDRWQHIRYVAQNFWKKYSGEFLSRMQQRPKWNSVKRNMQKGDMVLLCGENTPANLWPIGRITNTHPGQDGLVRVVTVRTSTGEYKRPIVKLALLPTMDNYETHALVCNCIQLKDNHGAK